MSKIKTNTKKTKNFNEKGMPDLWMSEKTGLEIKVDMADADKSEADFMTDHLNYIEAITQNLTQ